MLTLLASLCATSLARAADTSPQVWLISTCGMPQCGDLDAALQDACYWKLDEQCEWSCADAEDFRNTEDASMPTVVFVHGNRVSEENAVAGTLCVYRIIRGQACGRAFRYVIWLWPAERAIRPFGKDARLKTIYCDAESYYLAQWLNKLDAGAQVSLVGYSFGSRIVTGALDLLAGGELAGRRLPESTVDEWKAGKRNPVRAVLLAAAIDADWLQCHSPTLKLVDRMLVTCNGCDLLLRMYSRLNGRGGPQAMGYVGPCFNDVDNKVAVVDVSGQVGRIHDMRRYSAASGVCCRWAYYTFLEDSTPQNAP